MKRGAVLGGVVVLALAGGVAWFSVPTPAPPSDTDGQADLDMGAMLYAEHCASCHGDNLQGQDDWRTPNADGVLPAPPHDETGHTWHHPDSMLFTYTKLGGRATMAAQGIDFNSGMPGFADTLSDADIHSILAYIRSTWPERVRAHQSQRTADDVAAQGN